MEEGRAFTTRLVTGYPRLSPIERDDDIILMAQDAMKTTHLSFPRGRSLFPQKIGRLKHADRDEKERHKSILLNPSCSLWISLLQKQQLQETDKKVLITSRAFTRCRSSISLTKARSRLLPLQFQ